MLFFVEAFGTTGEERWLAAARAGTRWMEHHLGPAAEEWAGCGLLTGVGGWAVVLDELAAAGRDTRARALAGRVLETVAARASRTGDGVHWHDLTQMVWGTAGIGGLMLTLGPNYLGPDCPGPGRRRRGLAAGQASRGGGIRWSLGRAWEAEHPQDRRRFPNFAHGAAGIGFFLARLAQVTGEQRFAEASLAAAGWIMTTIRTDDDTCAAFHHDPGGTELFTLGWCHGPPGLGWLFRQLELTTGTASWRTWLRRAARADLLSGIPARREPGFWDNMARCCGWAGRGRVLPRPAPP